MNVEAAILVNYGGPPSAKRDDEHSRLHFGKHRIVW
jgi:hypothetical protein